MTLAAELVGHLPEGSPEWHAARDGAITSSRIAAVLGLSPWESPFSLWHRMMGVAPEQPVNDEMHWGTKLEPLILSEYAERRVHVGHSLAPKPGVFRNRARPWQMATPDGLDGDAVVEAKYAPQTDGWGDEGTEEIPVYYRAQVQWQMDVLGLRRTIVAVWFGGCAEYREYPIAYDPADIAVMREKAAAFRESLAAGDRPSIDGHAETYRVVRAMHPDIDNVRIDLPEPIGRRYVEALRIAKDAEEVKAEAVSSVLDAMGRARRAFLDGEQIAMRIPGPHGGPPFLRPTTRKPAGQKVRAAA